MKLFVGLFFFLFVFHSCTKFRTEITDQDLQKVLDRLAYLRLAQRLELEDLNLIKSDEELFLEICELNRIHPKFVLDKLKEKNSKLYKHLGRKYEN